MHFLSEENKHGHSEYVNQLRLKYSILEKSEARLSGRPLSEIRALRIDRDLKDEAIALKTEILSHELYFSSFAERKCESAVIREQYGSVSNFLYLIYDMAKGKTHGFVYIGIGTRDKRIMYSTDAGILLYPMQYEVKSAIDLWEHAYFADFGFDRARYLKCALASLDLSRYDSCLK